MRTLIRTRIRCLLPPVVFRLGPVSISIVAAIATMLAACNDEQSSQAADTGGDPQRGVALIRQNGCGSCHVIPGIEDATGFVGPPLTGVGRRIYLAGVERNTPDGMVAWLRNPQAVVPGNAMPDMQLDDRDARDIAAYLYTLR